MNEGGSPMTHHEPDAPTWLIWARWPASKDDDELDAGWTVMSFLLWSQAEADREVKRLQVATLGTPELRVVRYAPTDMRQQTLID
jgi:hypothetical protein